MSRLGKTPIILPKGVEIKMEGETVSVKGAKGVLTRVLPQGISLKMEAGSLLVLRDESPLLDSAFHGLYRSLLNNMILGVTQGFEERLVLVGVGYRAQVQGHSLDLQVGFSHPVKLRIPSSLTVAVEGNTTIVIKGIDKQLVGHFASTVRAKKPPEPYKQKGIRRKDEVVPKKAGKAAKGKAAG